MKIPLEDKKKRGVDNSLGVVEITPQIFSSIMPMKIFMKLKFTDLINYYNTRNELAREYPKASGW